jgi:hypothetical protein
MFLRETYHLCRWIFLNQGYFVKISGFEHFDNLLVETKKTDVATNKKPGRPISKQFEFLTHAFLSLGMQ